MKVKTLVFSGAIVWAALMAGSAVADSSSKEPGSGPSPYTDCGIGAALFPNTKWAAITSNVIWDVGTTAVISATSSPQTCSGKKVAAARFINATYASLSEETAAGHGEHLTTVLNILECAGDGRAAAVSRIRHDMGVQVANPQFVRQTHLEKASTFYKVIDEAVTASCSA
ncbi:MAG TPA: DUF3015 family protein [Steroidobacteraceae bacterium]|nr:DUF3015 family protein [Steroidobacteraceae bacterium]